MQILYACSSRNRWIKADSIHILSLTHKVQQQFHNVDISHFFAPGLSSHFAPNVGQSGKLKVDVHLFTKTTYILQKIDYFKGKSID